ncbi:hypothetical protein O181_107677, partial [Austropuccinia psidii MF-1]|nr:hypothetical protein [Austropuccinia psidii MF-1]
EVLIENESSEADSDTMDIDDYESSNEEIGEGKNGFLSNNMKKKIRTRIDEVIVPKGVTCITSQFGEAANGKLKASKWRVLFSVYIPLVFLDFFLENKPHNILLLVNTGALLQCTEIVRAKTITKDDAALFTQQYELYQITSNEIYPRIRVMPNHHYSMHIPEQLMCWGPLMGVLEFCGERLIGTLTKFKTNSINGAIEETLMKKFGKMQRLQDTTKKQEECIKQKKVIIKKSNRK